MLWQNNLRDQVGRRTARPPMAQPLRNLPPVTNPEMHSDDDVFSTATNE